MNTEPQLHVILGAGQIGARLAQHLLSHGHRVRLVRKTPQPAAAGGALEHLSGDISDLAFAETATQGARVVYDCMNPPYHQWPTHLLPIARGSLHGASRAGARLVALDCLYMYGVPQGPMREDSPRQPCSRKGALRLQLERLRLDAAERGDVKLAVGRASDFLGPALPLSLWNTRFLKRLAAGAAVECPGNPDMPHAYTWVDDVVRGLATLGERDEAVGQIWHLPTAPAVSTRALVERVAAALGTTARVRRLPTWLLRAAGVFVPFVRELAEMSYQWEVPYLLDDSRFVRTFGWSATPLETSVAALARWTEDNLRPPNSAQAGLGANGLR